MIVTLAASAVVAGLVICGIIAFAASENRGVHYVRGMERVTPRRGTAGSRPSGGVATGEGGDGPEETGPDEAGSDPNSDGDGPDEGDPNDGLNGGADGGGATGAHDSPSLPLAPLVASPRPAPDDGVTRRGPGAIGRRAVRSRSGAGPRPVPLVKFDAAGRTNAGHLGENADGYLIQEQLIAMADGISWATESRWADATDDYQWIHVDVDRAKSCTRPRTRSNFPVARPRRHAGDAAPARRRRP